jgi:hypothetical protein
LVHTVIRQDDANFLTGFANVLAEAVSTASRGAAPQVTVDRTKALVEEKDRPLDDLARMIRAALAA